MTALNALYVVAAVVVAVVGGVVALALWQGVTLLGAFKTEVLPRVEDLLTQVEALDMDQVRREIAAREQEEPAAASAATRS